MKVASIPRDYSGIHPRASGPPGDRLRALVDALWAGLSSQGVSWVGVYHGPGGRTEDGRIVGPDEMLLGPCRDKPACSPIGLHGVCGRAWRERRALVVRDVVTLGSNYVACDPRDRSEVVVPMLDEAGRCYAVLDLDSHQVGAFDDRDAEELGRLLVRFGLSPTGGAAPPPAL